MAVLATAPDGEEYIAVLPLHVELARRLLERMLDAPLWEGKIFAYLPSQGTNGTNGANGVLHIC